MPNPFREIKSIILDFDGVFTDNYVYLNEFGQETVKCSRSDGLGISNFRASTLSRNEKIDLLIVSTEKNPVVKKRSKKLKIKSHSGVTDKRSKIEKLFTSKSIHASDWEHVLYIGNDTNDLECIKRARLAFAPSDAHPSVVAVVDFIGTRRGGDGFVRECLEYFEAEYSKENI